MKLAKRNKAKKGFTLIELVVVIAILAILALILIPTISGYIGRANDARDDASAHSIYTAVLLHVSTTDDATIEAADLSSYIPSDAVNKLSAITYTETTGEVKFTYDGNSYTNGVKDTD